MVIRQSGVIPFFVEKGKIRIVLITTSQGRHWIIPKGYLESEMSPLDSAVNEALEEAGIEGIGFKEPAGTFLYNKRGNEFKIVVFFMKVTKIHAEWLEGDVRSRKIFSFKKACTRVAHKGLRKLLKRSKERILSLLNEGE